MVLFYISYIMLWASVLLLAHILRDGLREIIWLLRLREDINRTLTQGDDSGLVGTFAPQFSALILDAESRITLADLKGSRSILMFVNPVHVKSPQFKHLLTSMHGLWHRAEGNLYIVCSGRADECHDLIPTIRFGGHDGVAVPVMLDSDRAIEGAFSVNRTPMAVSLDENGRIEDYGIQLMIEEEAKR
jgi:hypothetical protein